MAIDHSKTYQKFSLKNLPHRRRLHTIIKLINKYSQSSKIKLEFADIGCSNGYITEKIRIQLGLDNATGFDHSTENLKIGKELYPNIDFKFIDLNQVIKNNPKYGLVTCFETLEHVGDLNNALKSIFMLADSQSLIIISVPIEIGIIGLIKFIIKTIIFNYSLTELYGKPSKWKYLISLLRNDISKYRESRNGWGTHYGFNYKVIDTILGKDGISYLAFNRFTTRFYVINQSLK